MSSPRGSFFSPSTLRSTLQNFEFGGSSVPHDPHTTAAAVMSRGHPTGVHVDIVSPLASQHVPYRGRDQANG
jgi:hypothetical protein